MLSSRVLAGIGYLSADSRDKRTYTRADPLEPGRCRS
jgi:hypothetical protein